MATATAPAAAAHPAIRKGNVAVLTGGASGIGLALAKLYAEAGMSVAVGDIDEEALESVPKEIRAFKVDVTSKESLEAFQREIEA